MNQRLRILAALAISTCAGIGAASDVSAQPVFNPANGHLYELVLQPGVTWAEADAAAAARPGNWHLATITSEAESAFVKAMLRAGPPFFEETCLSSSLVGRVCGGIWLGGRSSSNTAQDWQWVTGEPFTFTNWGPFEPFANGDRLRIDEFRDRSALLAWNDAPGGHLRSTGYLLENDDPAERLAFGLGPKAGDGGWFTTRWDLGGGFGAAAWGRLPWPTYTASGGGLRLAAGDVDGDGLDEIVVGLGPGGNGWIAVFDDGAHNHALLKWMQVQWPSYNTANGEVWPAVGDLDGDGRAEIVAGLGPGGAGWFEIFDDAAANFAHLAFRRVAWPAYTANASSVTRPAIGNVDGVGENEIIIGLGAGSNGWIEVVHGAAGNYAHRSWLQVNWKAYNAANGTTFPAAGDLDGDGRAEIVVGLGQGGGGWLEVLEDADAGFAHDAWLQLAWTAYNTSVGETHPAVGDIDGDGAVEIVVGLATMAGQGGWFEVFDGQSTDFARLGWRNLGWPAFTVAGGATYPAIGVFR